jgi:hypothetical protein
LHGDRSFGEADDFDDAVDAADRASKGVERRGITPKRLDRSVGVHPVGGGVHAQAAVVPGLAHQHPTIADRKRAVGAEPIDAKSSFLLEAEQVDEENLGRVAFPTKFGTPQPIEAFGTLR